MGKVYGNALFNIAATASENSRGGLFFDRDAMKPGTVIIPTRKGPKSFVVVYDSLVKEAVEKAPLMKVSRK